MTLTHAQELRALSELRDVYIRPCRMTVFGKVPPLEAVRQQYDPGTPPEVISNYADRRGI